MKGVGGRFALPKKIMSEKELMLLVDPLQEERLQKLREYNPTEHLKKWLAFNKSTGLNETVVYYPAAWRLYELSLKFPLANFSIEIIHMDPIKDLVVLKARLFFGEVYEKSPKRAEALKQGLLSQIDRVETKAKARAARDFGIGTEHALDMDDANEVEGTVVGGSLAANERGVTVNLANTQQRKNIQQLCNALKRECPNLETMTAEEATVIIQGLSTEAKEQAQQKKAAQHMRVVPSEPPTEEQPVDETPAPQDAIDLKKRFFAVYDTAKSCNLFEAHAGQKNENLTSFFTFASRILKANVTSQKQLTASRLSALEEYVAKFQQKAS